MQCVSFYFFYRDWETINLEEILSKHDKYNDISVELESSILSAMKEACRQTLELASENVDNVIEKSEEEVYIGLAQEINNSILDTINNLDTINSIK